jgi:hypothetical protein
MVIGGVALAADDEPLQKRASKEEVAFHVDLPVVYRSYLVRESQGIGTICHQQ